MVLAATRAARAVAPLEAVSVLSGGRNVLSYVSRKKRARAGDHGHIGRCDIVIAAATHKGGPRYENGVRVQSYRVRSLYPSEVPQHIAQDRHVLIRRYPWLFRDLGARRRVRHTLER